MSKLFNWAAARLAAAFALALPLAAMAEIQKTNPVTGETETYENVFTSETTEWNSAENWTLKESDKVPFVSGGNYDPALVTNKTVSTSTAIDGWTLRVGAYNGAAVTWDGGITKIQAGSLGCWLTADETSSITIASFAGNQLEGGDAAPFKLSSAKAGGITWSAGLTSSSNNSLPFWYYLKGAGTVVYGGDITVANAQVIKMADVALSGTSQVASKTLVTFGSGTTKTFTADAAVKIKDGDNVLRTVYLTSVTAGATTLTTEADVGTCELVQTSAGIDLYWVDGDPANLPAPTVYKPSININFTNGAGNGLTTGADVGLTGYEVPGTSWNNYVVANSTFSTVNAVDSTGAASAMSGVSVKISNVSGSWGCSGLTASSDFRQSYIDESASYPTPTVTVSGIPYYKYRVLVYHSTDTKNVPFGYDTINGTNYTYVNDALAEGTTAWGDSGAKDSANAIAEGGNVLVTEALSGSTLTVVGHRAGGANNARGCIAAIQIIEVKADVGENDLEIPVSGDTQYTVEETKELSGTVYLTGLGTLTLAGENKISAATIEISEGVTLVVNADRLDATTFTGAGTVVYDGSQPDTTKGFDNSAWTGTVWVKNVGDTSKGEATDAKVTTRLGSDTTDATSNELNKWGNANSFVKFTNVRAFMAKADVPWTLVLEDDDTNYAWYNNEGWTARSITIAALKGDGTFWDINDGGCRPYLNFGDASQFTGTIKALGKQVFLNDTTNTGDATSGLAGRITVPANQTLTVASGKTWHTRNGLVVNGTLNVNGTLASDSTTAAVRGSGTVVFTGSAPSPTGDAWWKNSAWTGTVEIKNHNFSANIALGTYGNSGSKVCMNGSEAYLHVLNNPDHNIAELVIGAGGFTQDGTYSSGTVTFTLPFKVTGTGVYTLSPGGNATKIVNLTGDLSEFSGYLSPTGANTRFVVGSTDRDYVAKSVVVGAGKVLRMGNFNAGPDGGLFIDEGGQVIIQDSGFLWTTGGVTVDGTLTTSSRANRIGGGTAITLGDNGVLEITGVDANESTAAYSNISGTGSIKYSGSGYLVLSANYPTDIPLIDEKENALVVPANGATIGSLSGTKGFRSDWSDTPVEGRYLTIKQAKDTTWSGSINQTAGNRLTGVVVDSGTSTTGTLTMSGTQTATVTLAVNGSVNLTGTWVGVTTVAGTIGGTGTLIGNLTFSDGATFKAFASDDEDGLVVSGTVGYPTEGTVTVDVSAIEPDADVALIKATDLNRDNFALADGTPEGYSLEVVDGVLTLTVPHVTITVPSIANTTVTVKIGDNTIGTSSGDYNVAPDSVVTVTYAAVDGYEISGTTEYTIDTSKGETTFDPAGTTEVKQYVASVTTGELVVKYTSLQAAIDATAQTNSKIVLLANEEDGATIPAVDGKMFYFYAGEFSHGEIANAEGNFITTSTEETISIGGAEVTATKYRVNAVVALVVLANEQSGTYYGDPMLAYNAFLAGPVGTTMQVFGNNPFSTEIPCTTYDSETQTYTKLAAVASITVGQVTSNYPSLADAVAAAEAGQTVTMLADDRVSFAAVTVEDGVPSGGSIVIDKNLTIDGSGFTVYGNTNADILNATGSATPGYDMVADLVDGSNLLGFFVKSGNVTFQNVTLTEFGNTAYVNKFGYTPIQTASAYTGKLTLTNVNFNKFNRTAVCVRSGTLEMTGGTVSGGTVNKNNGDYFQQPLEVRGGTATISGVTITGGDDVAGNGGGAIVAWGDTTVNNVNIDFTGVGVWADVANVAITGDDTEISATTQSVFVEEGGSATIAAGDFAGSLAVDSDANSSITVSGGTFDAVVPDEYLAEGYEVLDNGDGTYGVREDKGWVYSTPGYWNYTGTWSEGATLGEEKVTIEDGATYTATKASDGQFVTVAMTLSFDDVNDDEDGYEGAKAAIRLGAGEAEGAYVFQLYTYEGSAATWKNATGFTPTVETDYNVLFVLDLTNKTYTASIVSGATTNVLSIGESITAIPFACQGEVTPVQTIDFVGSGTVSSIEGSYEDAPAPEGFVEDEVVTLAGDDTATLTAAQATWLNACGAKVAVAAKIATMDSTAFNNAYLLNLDITGEFSYEFKVTNINVGDTTVTMTVSLTRTGVLDETTKINGTVVLTGTDELGKKFETISEATVADDDFSGSNTTTITLDKGDAKFFQPVIK